MLKIFAVYENIIEMDFKYKKSLVNFRAKEERMIISFMCSTEFQEN